MLINLSDSITTICMDFYAIRSTFVCHLNVLLSKGKDSLIYRKTYDSTQINFDLIITLSALSQYLDPSNLDYSVKFLIKRYVSLLLSAIRFLFSIWIILSFQTDIRASSQKRSVNHNKGMCCLVWP
uniref:Uncharacterized protein n=1 Tax=Glossina austeni TaxID=7395 RepID=A0A1A9VFR2_GLOAU